MPTPRYWIGTSWKMNNVFWEADLYAQALREADTASVDHVQRFVIPPFTSLWHVQGILADTSVKVGAQNMHWADAGAWTGEISAPMLTACGAEIVELGHSERRAHFGETDETVGLKVAAAVNNLLIPIICLGETRSQRDAGQAEETLRRQIEGALYNLSGWTKRAPMMFAYEPVWAIGDGGAPATPEYVEAQHQFISQCVKSTLGPSRPWPILYGGSVNEDNCEALIACQHVNGLFVGRAAWTVEGYLRILKLCEAAVA